MSYRSKVLLNVVLWKMFRKGCITLKVEELYRVLEESLFQIVNLMPKLMHVHWYYRHLHFCLYLTKSYIYKLLYLPSLGTYFSSAFRSSHMQIISSLRVFPKQRTSDCISPTRFPGSTKVQNGLQFFSPHILSMWLQYTVWQNLCSKWLLYYNKLNW